MKFLVSLIVFVCLSVANLSCGWITDTVKNPKTPVEQIAVDCGKQVIQDAVPNVLAEVNKILIDYTKTDEAKSMAIDQLRVSSQELLACAVRRAFEDLSDQFIKSAGGRDIEPAKSAAAFYLNKKRFQFSDGFAPTSPATDGGAGG